MNKNRFQIIESELKRSKILYYPGAGFDFETMILLIHNAPIETVYYVDYNSYEKYSHEKLKKNLTSNWDITNYFQIQPDYFGKSSWEDFWYNNINSNMFSKPINGYAFKIFLKNVFGREVVFYYLGTEATKTYEILLQSGIKSDIIVLQDHGFGGNWDKNCFGYNNEDDSRLYKISKENYSLPRLLFVAYNTIHWPEFERISRFEGKYGSAGHKRALFSRINDIKL